MWYFPHDTIASCKGHGLRPIGLRATGSRKVLAYIVILILFEKYAISMCCVLSTGAHVWAKSGQSIWASVYQKFDSTHFGLLQVGFKRVLSRPGIFLFSRDRS